MRDLMAPGAIFDPIKIGTGVGDRSGELGVLADFMFLDSQKML